MFPKNFVLNILKWLLPEIQERYHVGSMALFGSFARDEYSDECDIDVLIDFDKVVSLFDLTGLGCFLEDALQRKVDVVSRKALRQEISESVYHDAIIV